MKKSKRVLVAPLNWGLGHATRCIPIINKLLQNGFEVILASDGRSLQLLQIEFPKLQTIELPAYDISYATHSMIFNIAYQIPKILFAIWKENSFVKKVVKKEKIDIIISDNRFGCKTLQTKNIFITHQLNIIIPFKPLEWVVNKINQLKINQFDECWVPDFKGENNLAGRLSKSDRVKNVKYVGTLSRFEKKNLPKEYDILVILSGPEPQRTNLEKIIKEKLKGLNKKCLIIQGCTDKEEIIELNEQIKIVSYLNSTDLNEAILYSELVICRSGYSSIMDLIKLHKKAILVPTPGQTEQEYLASKLKQTQQFCIQSQTTFSLKEGLSEIAKKDFRKQETNGANNLEMAIQKLKIEKFSKHLA